MNMRVILSILEIVVAGIVVFYAGAERLSRTESVQSQGAAHIAPALE